MRKKKFLYFAAGFGAIATLGLSVLGVKAALPTTATECEHVGNHYEAVGATQLHAGNQEFWACCNCHEQFIAQPATGTWTDMGAYAGETLDAAHPAYVAPAAADAVIGQKIYTYDTESDGRTPNFHNGGTTWLEEFNGEYGVRKTAAGITDRLRFDIGSNVIDFNSVSVRIYFESDVSSVKIWNYWVGIAGTDSGKDAIPTNQWVTLTIGRDKIFSANTNFSNSGGHVDTAENFLADVFGTIGCSNQQAFYFDLYEGPGTGNLIKPAVYISWISVSEKDHVLGDKVYTYDTETDGRTPNLHNTWPTGTSWLPEYEGEYGVRKTPADITNELRFDIGKTVVDFTSVKVRVYFESEASSVKLASHWVNVAEGIPTNQWVTLTITRDKIFSANTNFSNSGGHVDTAENFLADVFGRIGYTNQQAFYFHIYANGNLIKPAVYISWISTVLPEGEGDTLLMGYDVSGNGDGTQLAPNFHSGGSTWIEDFKGELGVFRTNNASNTFKIGLGSKKTNFDYIKIRIYFEVDGCTDNLVRLYSHYAPIAEGYGSADYSGCLYANQWATLKINKASLMTPGSAWGVSGGAVDTDDNFYEAAFGQKGWYVQDIVNLTIYGGLHGGDGLKDANVYVSWVAAGVNPVVE